MSEKRKADYIFLLKKPGKKTMKIELFRGKQWSKLDPSAQIHHEYHNYNKFRIRLNGKWFGRDYEKMSFFYKFEFRDILFRSWKPEKDT